MTSEEPRTGPATGTAATGSPGRVALAIALYVGARLLIVAVIAGVLVAVGLPLLVALLVAIVVALPLSVVLFRPLRARMATEVDAVTATRRARRERLRAELRGDAGPDDGAPGDAGAGRPRDAAPEPDPSRERRS